MQLEIKSWQQAGTITRRKGVAMQEVFKKIIDQLKAESVIVDDEAGNRAVEIIEQAAEEFAHDTNVGNNRWIPCSERLPSDCEIHEVTAQFSNGKVYTEFAYYDEAKGEWWKHDNDGLVNVIAWKEPSAPYQPKGE